MREFIVETDMDLSIVIAFTGAGGVGFKPHGELIRCKYCAHFKQSEILGNTCALTDNHVTRNDFCSKAERVKE